MKKLLSFILLFGGTVAFAQYPAVDTFSTSGPVNLSGNWTTVPAGSRINGILQQNAGVITISGGSGFDFIGIAYYSGKTFGNDQYAQFVAGPDSVFNSNSSPMVRIQTASGAGYSWNWDTRSIRIINAAGSFSDITMTVPCPNELGQTGSGVTGNTMRIGAIGSTIYCFNMTLGTFGYGTDTTFTSGVPGIVLGSFVGHTSMSGPFQADDFPYSRNSVEASPYTALVPWPNVIDYYSPSAVTVTLTPEVAGWVICYTTDGSTPTATTPGACSHGTTYSTAFTISATGLTTVKTIGTKSGSTNSVENDYTYNIGANQVTQLNGVQIFPTNSIFNTNIASQPVDTTQNTAWHAVSGMDSVLLFHDFYTGPIGGPGAVGGIPYNLVTGSTPTFTIPPGNWFTPTESDDGPYSISATTFIENIPTLGCTNTSGLDQNTDYHLLNVANLGSGAAQLQEIYQASCTTGGNPWSGDSGAIWDLTSNALRPDTWTSADAAGLPITPFLAKYSEAISGKINHPLRFTLQATGDTYQWPGRHQAGKGGVLNTAALVRLKASFDISGFSPINQVILTALKNYGMYLADNGRNGNISGASDPNWSEDDLDLINVITLANFEVVNIAPLMSDPNSQAVVAATTTTGTISGSGKISGKGTIN